MKCSVIMILLPLLVLAGCDKVDEKPVPNRWFKPSQVALGQDVFRTHCEVCHGERGKGNQGWKQRLPDGSFPPPPLNGTGHTWHHRLSLLLRIIDDGGKLYSGKMPGFKGKLSKKEKIAVLAYVQSLWSPEVYSYWDKNLNGNEATR